MQYVEALLRQLPPFPYAPTALVLILFFIAVASHRIILMPLHNVPGPWYAAISDLWFTFHVLRLRRCRAINDLLTKYGPIVRVTPNRVIFNDINVMKSVYGVRNRLNKSTFYKCLQTWVLGIVLFGDILRLLIRRTNRNATDHAWIYFLHWFTYLWTTIFHRMTVVEHELHLVRKRGYASHYLPTNLSLFQREIYDTIHELIGVFDNTLLAKLPLLILQCSWPRSLTGLHRHPNWYSLSLISRVSQCLFSCRGLSIHFSYFDISSLISTVYIFSVIVTIHWRHGNKNYWEEAHLTHLQGLWVIFQNADSWSVYKYTCIKYFNLFPYLQTEKYTSKLVLVSTGIDPDQEVANLLRIRCISWTCTSFFLPFSSESVTYLCI